MLLALLTPIEDRSMFFVLMCLTALFMPFSSPNVIATVFDVTLPEVRSTAQSVEYFIENSGAALAPTLAGAIALATTKANCHLIGLYHSLDFVLYFLPGCPVLYRPRCQSPTGRDAQAGRTRTEFT